MGTWWFNGTLEGLIYWPVAGEGWYCHLDGLWSQRYTDGPGHEKELGYKKLSDAEARRRLRKKGFKMPPPLDNKKRRWFQQSDGSLIVWEGELNGFYHGPKSRKWTPRLGAQGPDDEVKRYKYEEISEARAVESIAKHGWIKPPVDMPTISHTTNKRRWFKNHDSTIVWEGGNGYYYYMSSWSKRHDAVSPDNELRIGSEELSESDAMALVKKKGGEAAWRECPPLKEEAKNGQKESAMTEYYYNNIKRADRVDSTITAYKIENNEALFITGSPRTSTPNTSRDCWTRSCHSVDTIRNGCQKVATYEEALKGPNNCDKVRAAEEEAKTGPSEPTNAFEVGRNELISALAITQDQLSSAAITAYDQLRGLNSRSEQIGDAITNFQREHSAHAF